MNKLPNHVSQFQFIKNNIWNTIAKITLGIAILAISSQLSIPLEPVPLTFQSTTVILLALLFGPTITGFIVVGYFMAGIAGLPVFADFSFGLGKFFGPSGGYLIGFLPAAIASGYLAQSGFANNLITTLITVCAGTAIIFLCGFLQLSLFVGQEQAFQLGIDPFFFSESFKVIAATFLYSRIGKKKFHSNGT